MPEDAAHFAPAPADTGEERLARLRLIRSRRVGPVTYRRLMAAHGTAQAALAALPAMATEAGDAAYRPCAEADARAEGRAARTAGARLVTLGDADYPDALAELDDAPPVLWAQGDAGLMAAPCVAVVGTRNASSLGLRMARALARGLLEAGVTVVSGLAKGIDAAAHNAALPRTVAVHAGGLDKPYPDENAALAARIAAEGLSLSAQPFHLEPRARDFPRRNRIVSGLSRAVVVVEAAARSGSMITARDALDQGREVMAVPSHPFETRASGCLMLLRDGATLVRGPDDVLAALDGQPVERTAAPAEPVPARAAEGDLQGRVLALLSPVPVAEADLLRDLGDPDPRAVASVLSELELGGAVLRRPGGGLVLGDAASG